MFSLRNLKFRKHSRRIMLVEVAIVGLVGYWLCRDPRALKGYEERFLAKIVHPHKNPHEPIPSKFRNQEELALKLCQKFVKRNKPPRIEARYLGLKKATHKPVLIEMVRCGKGVALVQAPGHNCFYTLKKGNRSKKYDTKLYTISRKGYYITKYDADVDEPVDENHPTLARAVSMNEHDDSSGSLSAEYDNVPFQRSLSVPRDFMHEPSNPRIVSTSINKKYPEVRRQKLAAFQPPEYLERTFSVPTNYRARSHLAVRSPEFDKLIDGVKLPEDKKVSKYHPSRSRLNKGNDEFDSSDQSYPSSQTKKGTVGGLFRRLLSKRSKRPRKRTDRSNVLMDLDRAKLFRSASAPRAYPPTLPANQYPAPPNYATIPRDERPSMPYDHPPQSGRFNSNPRGYPPGSHVVHPYHPEYGRTSRHPAPPQGDRDGITHRVSLKPPANNPTYPYAIPYAVPYAFPHHPSYFVEPNVNRPQSATHRRNRPLSEKDVYAGRGYLSDGDSPKRRSASKQYDLSYQWMPQEPPYGANYNQFHHSTSLPPSYNYAEQDKLSTRKSKVNLVNPLQAPSQNTRNHHAHSSVGPQPTHKSHNYAERDKLSSRKSSINLVNPLQVPNPLGHSGVDPRLSTHDFPQARVAPDPRYSSTAVPVTQHAQPRQNAAGHQTGRSHRSMYNQPTAQASSSVPASNRGPKICSKCQSKIALNRHIQGEREREKLKATSISRGKDDASVENHHSCKHLATEKPIIDITHKPPPDYPPTQRSNRSKHGRSLSAGHIPPTVLNESSQMAGEQRPEYARSIFKGPPPQPQLHVRDPLARSEKQSRKVGESEKPMPSSSTRVGEPGKRVPDSATRSKKQPSTIAQSVKEKRDSSARENKSSTSLKSKPTIRTHGPSIERESVKAENVSKRRPGPK